MLILSFQDTFNKNPKSEVIGQNFQMIKNTARLIGIMKVAKVQWLPIFTNKRSLAIINKGTAAQISLLRRQHMLESMCKISASKTKLMISFRWSSMIHHVCGNFNLFSSYLFQFSVVCLFFCLFLPIFFIFWNYLMWFEPVLFTLKNENKNRTIL